MDRSRFIDDIRAAEKQNLKKFMLDLVDYCLKAVGLQWPTPDEDGLHQRVLFEASMGDVILRYRNANDEQYRMTVRTGKPLDNMFGFVSLFMKAHFENYSRNAAPRLLFGFCAFVVDLAIFCCRYHRPIKVFHALEVAGEVYNEYLSEYGEEALWTDFKSYVAEMGREYEHAPVVLEIEEVGEDCYSTSLSDSSHSETEDLAICLERRRRDKEKEDSNPQ